MNIRFSDLYFGACLLLSGTSPLLALEPGAVFGDSAEDGHWLASDAIVPASFAKCGHDESGCANLDDCGLGCDNANEACGCGGKGFCGAMHAFDDYTMPKLSIDSVFDSDFSMKSGAELRWRFMDERNRLRPQGPGRSTYDLWRFAPYLELSYKDLFTVHGTGFHADIFGEDLPPVNIDVNRYDMLKYYVDFKVAKDEEFGALRGRVGRDFLLYGKQRLLSPLGWANTYRNFEGIKFYWKKDESTLDGFFMQSVNGPAGGDFRPESFDTADHNRWIAGLYGTKAKAIGNNNLEYYWLWSKEDDAARNRHDGNRHTIGLRLNGGKEVESLRGTNKLAWDFEGAFQFGRDNFDNNVGGAERLDVWAGFFTAELSHTWASLPWSPTIKGLYYYGSGDDDPNDGQINTFFSLYPLGHAYWGLIDNFSGQNLIDYAITGSVKPCDNLTFATTLHIFDKARSQDFVYNIAGAPFGDTVSGELIGQEVDIITTWQVNKDLQIQLGYLIFLYGDAINDTAQARDDASQLYLMTTWLF